MKAPGLLTNIPRSLKFGITSILWPLLNLLGLLVSRVIADNAFEAGFQTVDEVLRPTYALEEGVNFVPLSWKADIMEK